MSAALPVVIAAFGAMFSHQDTHCDCAAYRAQITSAEVDTVTVQPSASLELRWWERLGLVLGYGRARREGHATATRDAHGQAVATGGVHADIQQTIDVQWASLQAAWTQPVGRVSLRGTAGLALAWADNYERGTHNGAWVEHRNSMRETAPIFGLGIELPLRNRWLLRAEVQHLRGVATSYWTERSDITTYGVQIGRRFR